MKAYETRHYIEHPVLHNRLLYLLNVLNNYYPKSKKIAESQEFANFKSDTYWLFDKLCPELSCANSEDFVESFNRERHAKGYFQIYVRIIPKVA
ncbi:hypothetical protein AsFcp4_290 [Aeromonas phage AsFcp_4]|uniref:Uncharacterized protein n=1 Tax=Aeromonas phage PX29 TaxID=926067 RepID=E5DQ67_9CAUD|nr:hypothetical protein CL89_gp134 [Aeromonas phage PX29]ADQ52853.1 conserved hypothetical protein [Aeromonas phage PX29]QAX98397.1 hypothetical protein ASfcp2_53 [Aeromonas phage AsFcp_2]QAX99740.1 hypothetical protein AsFcp4_290 [Aeromonas phage AsFcp_4]